MIIPGHLYEVIIDKLSLYNQYNDIHFAIKGDVLLLTRVLDNGFHIISYEFIYKNLVLKLSYFEAPQPKYCLRQITQTHETQLWKQIVV